MNTWTHRFVASIETIGRDAWQSVCTTDYPFLRFDFLHALEVSRCTSEASGWQPHHLWIQQGDTTVAVMPLYIKTNSYGEYVFDWSWADAYYRHGVAYYPKLLSAIPFTPCTGPRWGAQPNIASETLIPYLLNAITSEAKRMGASSWHGLFSEQSVALQFERSGAALRLGCQYHWENNNYTSFDDFLAQFASRKRKNLRKEREKVNQQHIEIIRKPGAQVTSQEWENFYQFYHFTYFKRSGRQGYLNQAFFQQLANTMADAVMMVVARYQGEMIAGALFFHDNHCLYGRYWGCSQEFEFLHFEACYYQGIEYAIEKKLQRFDPGAQGEHKIQRGFTPRLTYSNHWIAHPQFASAIQHFLTEEKPQIQAYCEDAKTLLPFRADVLQADTQPTDATLKE